MSTRSTIGVLDLEQGTVRSIYCHFDGYPEWVGTILDQSYTSPEKINALIELGDLSSLGHEIGEKHDFETHIEGICRAYGRDRGEVDVGAQDHPSIYDWIRNREGAGCEFGYLWVGTTWITYTID